MDQATQDKIWDYWQTTGIKSFASNTGRLDYVAKLVFKTRKQKVLTIGVGDLYLEKVMLRNRVDLYVMDPSEATISSAHDSLQLDPSRVMVGYSQDMPFEADSFDVVVMSEVLEHLDDDVLERTIQELYRVLRKGGQFIGTVPFNEDLEHIMCPHCTSVFHRVGHVRSFDKKSLRKAINAVFEDDNIKVWVKFLPAWPILNFKGRLVAILKKILEFFSSYASKSNLIVTATK